MKDKLKDYIDQIFADAPNTQRAREMKEELYSNISDRYDDLIREGKSETAAYNISIEGIGEKRRKLLVKKFGTVEEIKRASIEDLMQVDSIGRKQAETIKAYFEEES